MIIENNRIVHIANSIRKVLGYRFPRLGRHANSLFFSLMPEQFEAALFPGIMVPLKKSDLTQRATYWRGIRFEYPTARILQSWISPETTHFFDIGSNYGFFSYWMLSQSPSLRVHAFEPHPTTCALLQDIKTRNHLTRLTPWNIGLGDVVAQLSLQPGTEDSGWSTFGTNPSFESSRIADIAVQPFSLWADQLGLALPDHPAWIAKIDVEGFELKVLRGMEAALKQHAFQGICIEINDYTLKLCGTKSEDIFAFLHTCGYRQVLPHPCGNAFFIPA